MKKINDAIRLHKILKHAKHIQPQHQSYKSIWYKTLNVDNDDAFILKFGQLIKLVRRVRKLGDNLDQSEKVLYQRNFNKIENLISINQLSNNWENLETNYNEETLQPLEFFGNYLQAKINEKELDKNEIDNWKNQINEIQNSIIHSSIDKKAKEIFVKILSSFIDSVNYYEINGIDGFEEATVSIIGAITIWRSSSDQNTENKDIISQLYEFVIKVSTIIEKTSAAAQVGSAVVAGLLN